MPYKKDEQNNTIYDPGQESALDKVKSAINNLSSPGGMESAKNFVENHSQTSTEPKEVTNKTIGGKLKDLEYDDEGNYISKRTNQSTAKPGGLFEQTLNNIQSVEEKVAENPSLFDKYKTPEPEDDTAYGAAKVTRKNADMAYKGDSWGDYGITGTKRNEAGEDGAYHWKGHQNEDGTYTPGLAEWASDDQARISAGIDRYNDTIEHGTYHTEAEVQAEEQEWANLVYDCGNLEEYQQQIVDDFKAKYDQTYASASEEDKKILDAQLAAYQSDLDTFKSWKNDSKEMYERWSGLNEAYDRVDDNKKQDVNDISLYESSNYMTPDMIREEIAFYDSVIKEETERTSALGLGLYSTTRGLLGGSMDGGLYGRFVKGNVTPDEVSDTIADANAKKEELEALLVKAEATEQSIKNQNDDIDYFREHYLFTPEGGWDWTAIEADLLTKKDQASTLAETEEINSHLDFVHRRQNENREAEYYKKYNVSETIQNWDKMSDAEKKAYVDSLDEKISSIKYGDKQPQSISVSTNELDAKQAELAKKKAEYSNFDKTFTTNETDPVKAAEARNAAKATLLTEIKSLQLEIEDLKAVSPSSSGGLLQTVTSWFKKDEKSELTPEEQKLISEQRELTAEEKIELSVLETAKEYTDALTLNDTIKKIQKDNPDKDVGEVWVGQATAKVESTKQAWDSAKDLVKEARRDLLKTGQLSKDTITALKKAGLYDSVTAVIGGESIKVDSAEWYNFVANSAIFDSLPYVMDKQGAYYAAVDELAYAENQQDSDLTKRKDYASKVQKGQELYETVITKANEQINSGDKSGAIATLAAAFGQEEAEAYVNMFKAWGVGTKAVTPRLEGMPEGKTSLLESIWYGSLEDFGAEKGFFTENQYNAFLYRLGDGGLKAAADGALKINSNINKEHKAEIVSRAADVAEAAGAELRERGIPGAIAAGGLALTDMTLSAGSSILSPIDFVINQQQLSTLGTLYSSEKMSISEYGKGIHQAGVSAANAVTDYAKNTEFWYNVGEATITSWLTRGAGKGIASALGLSTVAGTGIPFFGKTAADSLAVLYTDLNFAMNSYSDTLSELTSAGVDKDVAQLASFATGFAEAFFEHFSVENLIHFKTPLNAGQLAKALLGQGMIEASEESATGLVQRALNRFILQDESDFAKRKNYYMRTYHISENEATKYATHEALREISTETAAGFFSGLFGAGFESAQSGIKMYSQNQMYTEFGKILSETKNSNGDSFGKVMGQYFSEYEFIPKGQENRFSEAEENLVENIQYLAEKAANGKASDKELGAMMTYINEFGYDAMADFALANPEYGAIDLPAYLAGLQNSMISLYGADAAYAYMKAYDNAINSQDVGDVVYVADEFESFLRSQGIKLEEKDMSELTGLMMQILSGSENTSKEAIEKAFSSEKFSDPKVQMGVWLYLQKRIGDANDPVNAAVTAKKEAGTQLINQIEELKIQLETTTDEVEKILIEEKIKALQGELAEIGLFSADMKLRSIDADIFAAISPLLETSGEVTADNVATKLTNTLTTAWDLLNQGRKINSAQSQGYVSALSYAASKGDTSKQYVQGLSSNRHDDDAIILRAGNKVITRKEFVAAAQKNQDLFTGAEFTNGALSESQANARFDSYMIAYAFDPEDKGITYSVKYNLRSGNTRTEEEIKDAKKEFDKLVNGKPSQTNIVSAIPEDAVTYKQKWSNLTEEQLEAEKDKLTKEHTVLILKGDDANKARLKEVNQRLSDIEHDLKVLRERKANGSTLRSDTQQRSNVANDGGNGEAVSGGQVGSAQGTANAKNSGGASSVSSGSQGVSTQNGQSGSGRVKLDETGGVQIENGYTIYDSAKDSNTDNLTTQERALLEEAKASGADRVLFVYADKMYNALGCQIAGSTITLSDGSKVVVINSNHDMRNGTHEIRHALMESLKQLSDAASKKKDYGKKVRLKFVFAFIEKVFEGKDELFDKLFTYYEEKCGKAYTNLSKEDFLEYVYEEIFCDLTSPDNSDNPTGLDRMSMVDGKSVLRNDLPELTARAMDFLNSSGVRAYVEAGGKNKKGGAVSFAEFNRTNKSGTKTEAKTEEKTETKAETKPETKKSSKQKADNTTPLLDGLDTLTDKELQSRLKQAQDQLKNAKTEYQKSVAQGTILYLQDEIDKRKQSKQKPVIPSKAQTEEKKKGKNAKKEKANPLASMSDDELYTRILTLDQLQSNPNVSDEIKESTRATLDELKAEQARRNPTGDQRFSIIDSNHNEWAPVFYSKMQRTIEDWTTNSGKPFPGKMGADQVISWLKGKGVKSEEIKWSGIEQWLEGKKSVTKDELLQFMAKNELNVTTVLILPYDDLFYTDDGVRLSGINSLYDRAEKIAEERGYNGLDVRAYDIKDDYGYRIGVRFQISANEHTGLEEPEPLFKAYWAENATPSGVDRVVKGTRWNKYSLPGGTFYREVLFDLPYAYSNESMRMHWGNPKTGGEGEGVFAHARIADHKDSDGNSVLLVEEIQSDWHNRLAKVGYLTPERDELADLMGNKEFGFRQFTEEDKKRYDELYNKYVTPFAERRDKLREETQDAYDKILGIAQKLGDHLQNDYDLDERVPVKRYANSKEYDLRDNSDWGDIFYNFMLEKNYSVKQLESIGLLSPEDAQYIIDNRKAVIDAENSRDEYHDAVKGIEERIPNIPFAGSSDTYHEYVMKHLIRMAAEGGYDKIAWTNSQQQVDRWADDYAKGYNIEYDQAITNFMKKYTAQWGTNFDATSKNKNGTWAKHNSTTTLENGEEVWSVDITPEMRRDVLTVGQPRYSIIEKTDSDYMAAVNNDDLDTAQKIIASVAKKNGYKKHAYHGTLAYGFNEFRMISTRELGVHFGTEAAARVFYNNTYNRRGYGENPGIYDVYLKMENTLKTPDVWGDPEALDTIIKRVNSWVENGYNEHRAGAEDVKWTKADSKKLRDALKINDDYYAYEKACNEWWEETQRFKRIEEFVDPATNKVYSLDEAWDLADSEAAKLGFPRVFIRDDGNGKQTFCATDSKRRNTTELFTFNGSYNGVAIKDRVDEAAWKANQLAQTYLLNLGYDSIRYVNEMEDIGSESYIILKPENIKRADPVVYDNSGEVIPPSARFNDEVKDVRYSVLNGVVDQNGKIYDHVIRLLYPYDKEVMQDADHFDNYVRQVLQGAYITTLDQNGKPQDIQFATDEPVIKHNFEHPAISELAYGRKTGRPSWLVYLNAKEVLDNSKFDEHTPQNPDWWNNHEWLDEGGWDKRTAYVLDKNNILFPVQLFIANTRDGRKMLYHAAVNTPNGVPIDLASTARNNPRENFRRRMQTLDRPEGYKTLEEIEAERALAQREEDEAALRVTEDRNSIISPEQGEFETPENGEPAVMDSIPEQGLENRYSIVLDTMPHGKQNIKVSDSSVTKTTRLTDNGELYLTTVRELRNEALRNNEWYKNTFGDELDTYINKINTFMDRIAKEIVSADERFQYLGLQDLANATLKIDPVTNTYNLTAMVPNGDYEINFDFGTICERRAALQQIVDSLLEKATYDETGTASIALDENTIMEMNKALQKEGINTQCLICFVETKRFNQASGFMEFTNLWNSEVKKYLNGRQADRFNFAEGTEDLTEEHIQARRKAVAEASYSGTKEAAVKNFVKLLAQYSPEDLKLLTLRDINSSTGRTNIINTFPEINTLIMKSGSSAPKPVYAFTPYNGEIESMTYTGKNYESLKDYVKSLGGIRSQSFSDFIISHVFDHLQKTAGLTAMDLPAHTYTKVLARAVLFGMTGEKINMSILCGLSRNVGSWYSGLNQEATDWDYNTDDHRNRPYLFADARAYREGEAEYIQSFPWDDAVDLELKDGYAGNVGPIVVGLSYWHNLLLQRDPLVAMVIAYHASSMPKNVKQAMGVGRAANYEPVQNTLRLRTVDEVKTSKKTGKTSVTKHAGLYRPNYAIPNNVPTYATPPQSIGKKKGASAKYTAVGFNDFKGEALEKAKMLFHDGNIAEAFEDYMMEHGDLSESEAARAYMVEMLEFLNEQGLTLDTEKAEKGHGEFDLYSDLEQTNDPYETSDNYIAYCLKNNEIPMFYEFLPDINYFKRVFDFTVFDPRSYNPETGRYEKYAPQESVNMLDENGEFLFPGGEDGFVDYMLKYMGQYNDQQAEVYRLLHDENFMQQMEDIVDTRNSSIEPEEGEAVHQDHTSAGTSIAYKDGKLPLLFGRYVNDGLVEFEEGGTNIDVGGGKYDTISEFLKDTFGVDNYVFDPFNRTEEHNRSVFNRIANGQQFDTATSSNVLNVIDNAAARENVVLEMAKALKPDGRAYFVMYKAPGEGGEVKTRPDQWQESKKAAEYLPEIRKYFGQADVVKGSSGGLVLATDPRPEGKAAWQLAENGPTMRYSVLTPEKAIDYNNSKTEAGDSLKTLGGSTIARGGSLKGIRYDVGKVIGGQLYIHKEYLDTVANKNPEFTDVFNKAESLLREKYPDFDYQCITYDPVAKTIMFQEAPGFDTEREPFVGNMVKVDTINNTVNDMKDVRQIWHHKWQWVGNDYTGFNVEDSWEWSREWLNKIKGSSKGGSIQAWNNQLNQYGLPHDEQVEERYSSIGPEQRFSVISDTEYNQAVESGDMETAQKLVDEAARAAGYTLLGYKGIRGEKRGNSYPFTVFKSKAGGIFLATDREVAEAFAKGWDNSSKQTTPGTVLQLYTKFDNPYYIYLNGENPPDWTAIPTPQEMKDFDPSIGDTTYTDEIGIVAKLMGYDGVILMNVKEGSGHTTTDIIATTPDQIKLADPVTYDDDGNVIPLSERFNPENPDMRFSIISREDSDGNELSQDQIDYFADSKIRDENGNLLVVYHGTEADFTVFDRTKGRSNMDIQGSFFSPWELDASGYGSKVGAYYLNIKNPASESVGYRALRMFQGQNEAGVKARKYLERLGYDGVNNGNEEYIAFYPEQIKLISNKNPTENPDIRFSIIAPVDQFGNEVQVSESNPPVLQSDLSENLYYSDDGNTAYIQTEDGQTVVLNDIGADSPEARYINYLEATNNANNANTTTTKPYIIPPRSRYEGNGYNLGEQNAGLRRGAEEVSAQDQERTSGRAGSFAERNGQSGSQSTEEEGIESRYSILYDDEDETFYNENGEPIATKDMYPKGTIQRMLFDMAEKGDASFEELNEVIQKMIDDNTPIEQSAYDAVREIVENNPNITEAQRQAVYDTMDKLVKKHGMHRYTDKDANKDVHFAKKNKKGKTIMKGAQTIGRNGPEWLTVEMMRAALNEVSMSYAPMPNDEAIRRAEAIIKEKGYKGALQYFQSVADSGKQPTQVDVALGEILLKNAAAEGAANDAMRLSADLTIMAHYTGQALQAFNILRKLTPDGQLYYLTKVVNDLNKKYESRINNPKSKQQKIVLKTELVDKLLAASTRQELDDAVEEIKKDIASQIPATFGDQYNAWRYLAMLGNPKTHIRNFFGNAGFMPAVFAKDFLARRLEAYAYKKGKLKDRNRLTGADLSRNGAYRRRAAEDFKVMQDVLTGKASGSGNRFSDANDIMEMRKIFNIEPLEKLRKWNGGKLEDEDLRFMWVYYTRAFAEGLQARGIKEEDVNTFDQTPEGKQILNDIRAFAVNEAWRDTYHDANKLAQSLNQMKHNNKFFYVVLEGVVPFTKTPANILKRGIEYSPIGLIQSVIQLRRDLASGEYTTSECLDRLAAGITGTALIAIGAFLSHLGILRGAGPDDDEEDAFEKLQGHQAWSLRFGNTSYTIDWMAPTALPLFTGSALDKMMEGETGFGSFSEWIQLFTKLMDPMMSLSMLDGINNVFNSISNNRNTSALGAVALQAITGYITQVMPTFFGQVARSIDPYTRTTFVQNEDKDAWVKRLLQSSFQSKIPGVIEAAEQLIGKGDIDIPFTAENRMKSVDSWGRTEKAESAGDWILKVFENFLSPGYISTINETPVDQEIWRVYEGTDGASKLPSKGKTYFKYSVDDESIKKNMTADEYERFATKRGQMAYDILDSLFASDEYKSIDNINDQAKMIDNAFKYADDLAKRDIAPDYGIEKWMSLAEKVGPVDYILIKSDYEDNKSVEKVFQWLAAQPGLTEEQVGLLIANKYNMPDTIDNVGADGYVYDLNDGDEYPIKELNEEIVAQKLKELKQTNAWKNAAGDFIKEGRLLRELYEDAKKDTAIAYSKALGQTDRATHVGKASSLGSDAFDKILELDVDEWGSWLAEKYRADSTIRNTAHDGYDLSLSYTQKRDLEDKFKVAWDAAVDELLADPEFQNASTRNAQRNMMADKYNQVSAIVEDEYAKELYASGDVKETLRKASTYKAWDDAYEASKKLFTNDTERLEWLAGKISAGTGISDKNDPGYKYVLSTAQNEDIEDLARRAFVPRAEKMIAEHADWNSMTLTEQAKLVKEVMDDVFDEQAAAYIKGLGEKGYGTKVYDKDASRETFYKYLENSSESSADKKKKFVDKYSYTTIKDPEATIYHDRIYMDYINAHWDEAAKINTAKAYEDLHDDAMELAKNKTKSKYGKSVTKIEDPDYAEKYNAPSLPDTREPAVPVGTRSEPAGTKTESTTTTPKTESKTTGSGNYTQFVIPPAYSTTSSSSSTSTTPPEPIQISKSVDPITGKMDPITAAVNETIKQEYTRRGWEKPEQGGTYELIPYESRKQYEKYGPILEEFDVKPYDFLLSNQQGYVFSVAGLLDWAERNNVSTDQFRDELVFEMNGGGPAVVGEPVYENDPTYAVNELYIAWQADNDGYESFEDYLNAPHHQKWLQDIAQEQTDAAGYNWSPFLGSSRRTYSGTGQKAVRRGSGINSNNNIWRRIMR